jgi:hypothetical protein
MTPVTKAFVKVQEMMAMVLHDSIVKAAAIRDGDLWTQEVTKEGILLRRVEQELKTK